MTRQDVLIVGGGFAGIYAAWRLARGGLRVTLIEAADHLGGTLWSRDWNGYLVDPGTHNFDLRSPIGSEFYTDILGDELGETDRHDFGSTTDRAVTRGFEMPDFSQDDPELCTAALRELAELLRHPSETALSGLDAWLRATYGATLGGRLASLASKVIGGTPDDLAVEARGALGMLTRPKIGSDAEMIALKANDPFWDARLGVTLDCGDPRFMGRSVSKRFGYPKRGALRRFCTAAEERLRDLGVEVLTDMRVSSIDADAVGVEVGTAGGPLRGGRLFWTLPDHSLLSLLGLGIDVNAAFRPVGSAFFVYEVPASAVMDIDYLHDFSPARRPYRYNRAGIYSGQVKPDGSTFVMAEVPAHPANLGGLLQDAVADEVWRAVLDVGFVAKDAGAAARTYWGYPVAYTLPRIGWQGPLEAAARAVASVSPRLSTIDFGHRGRHAFMTFYEDSLQDELKN